LSLAGGVYVLPLREDCLEAFMWLAQQVRQAGGEALVIRAGQFEGLTDQEVIVQFRQARQEDYVTLNAQAAQLAETLAQHSEMEGRLALKDELERLQKQHAEIARIDYFECPERAALATRLARIRQAFLPEPTTPGEIAACDVAAYRDAHWVTRAHPHVDRLACAWLIRRFVNPDAPIRYATEPEAGEIPFDMPDAEFSHYGDLCTFEVMLRALSLHDPALHALAEIVHEVDLRDGVYARPETGGVDALLRGWQLAGLPDTEMEARGLWLFDGLCAALSVDSLTP
ncbi:MAG: chromate resistance protein, partial [Spongiibacteraceae bacterium]|nr:chromate resistance protein [Spongiibacteraceae bacterium]